MLALKKLHHLLLYAQVVKAEIDRAGQKLSAADEDLGKVRAAIRTTGLRGVRFGSAQSGVDICFCCEAGVE